jgi:4-aminobutyrate aminotransferase/(S)-3-amino-2-methylpropionate transaminase
MRDLDLAGAARRVGTQMGTALHELKDTWAAVGDVRGRGAMQAVELVRPGTNEPDAAAAGAIATACHQAGVVVLTCGTWGNVIRLLPPLVIDEALLAEGLSVLTDACTTVLG